ncbi:hypothetical protein, partial [Capnocytophaga canis]|uniref:hypothetical protein n=1 Tax=Capnocytophaga canis TaxID=1848903 RepID=UPI0037D4098D
LLTSMNVNNYKIDTKMKLALIQALALSALTAESSDTAVIQAIQERINEEKSAREKAENELNAFKKAQIEAVLEAAIKEKKIAETQKEVYQKIAETSGIEALNVVLANAGSKEPAKPQAPSITDLIQKKQNTANASWTFDEWQKNDPKGLEKMSVENPEEFKKLFNAKYKRD